MKWTLRGLPAADPRKVVSFECTAERRGFAIQRTANGKRWEYNVVHISTGILCSFSCDNVAKAREYLKAIVGINVPWDHVVTRPQLQAYTEEIKQANLRVRNGGLSTEQLHDEHLEHFLSVYETQLQYCLATYPQSYHYTAAYIPMMVGKMRKALKDGTYDRNGLAFTLTCQAVGIENTYTAVKAYLYQETGAHV